MFLSPELIAEIKALQASGKKVVFTNGCFDILHVGHADYLQKSSELGDALIVAVNTDDSVKRLEKGSGRPVNSEANRLKMIQSLKAVHSAFLFDEDTPLAAINALRPDILVKGADYDPSETDQNSPRYIVGSAEVKKYGGEVKAISITEGFSTTSLIQKIKKAY